MGTGKGLIRRTPKATVTDMGMDTGTVMATDLPRPFPGICAR